MSTTAGRVATSPGTRWGSPLAAAARRCRGGRRWYHAGSTLVVIGLGVLVGPLPVTAHDQGDPLASACGIQARPHVRPVLAALGEPIGLTDELVFSCPRRRWPFHLALVAYRPDVPGPNAAWVPPAMTHLANTLGVDAQGWVAASLTAYAAHASELCAPERDPRRLAACAARLEATSVGAGTTGLPAAIMLAWKGLRAARADNRLQQAEEPLREGLVAVLPPVPLGAATCELAWGAIDRARADGVEVTLVCAGGPCANSCLATAVPEDRMAPADAWPAIAARQVALARASELRVAEVTLRETLTRAVTLEPGSEDPPSSVYDRSSGALSWQLPVPATQRLEVSFAVRAHQPGQVTLVGNGFLAFTDSYGRNGNAMLPPRQALVGWRAALPYAGRPAAAPDP